MSTHITGPYQQSLFITGQLMALYGTVYWVAFGGGVVKFGHFDRHFTYCTFLDFVLTNFKLYKFQTLQ